MDAAGMNTIGADQRAFDLSLKLGFDPLQIGAPRPLAFIVSMTDGIAHRSVLSANRTNSRHLVSYPFDNFRCRKSLQVGDHSHPAAIPFD